MSKKFCIKEFSLKRFCIICINNKSYAELMRNLCRTYAELMQNLSGTFAVTSAELLERLCGTYASGSHLRMAAAYEWRAVHPSRCVFVCCQVVG